MVLRDIILFLQFQHCAHGTMDLQDAQNWLLSFLDEFSIHFQKLPGSAIFLRYVKSSYQNDPVRSAVELFLFLFAVRYLLAPKYSTQKQNYVPLSDEVRSKPAAPSVIVG